MQRLLWDIRNRPQISAAYAADPESTLAGYELADVDAEAFRKKDFARLYDRGANPYLLYFCALQLGVDRNDYYAALRATAPAGCTRG